MMNKQIFILLASFCLAQPGSLQGCDGGSTAAQQALGEVVVRPVVETVLAAGGVGSSVVAALAGVSVPIIVYRSKDNIEKMIVEVKDGKVKSVSQKEDIDNLVKMSLATGVASLSVGMLGVSAKMFASNSAEGYKNLGKYGIQYTALNALLGLGCIAVKHGLGVEDLRLRHSAGLSGLLAALYALNQITNKGPIISI